MSIESRSRQYGKVFDHWHIKEYLGSGSGGKTAVFRLARSDSNRGVSALKVVNLIEVRGDINNLSEFRRKEYETARDECSRNAEQEVWLMDDLRGNTNIVDYLDHTFVDWSDETGFGRDLLIRMELLKDLRSELQDGRIFSEMEALKVGRDICIALIRCHRKNILHRDIKPENIFRNKDGDYKLGDFGVSRVLDACPGAVASTGIGTYEYWPAEQMTGLYDKRVDIYSLGLVLYELCNQNRLPFAASTYVTGREVSMRLSGTSLPEPSDASAALSEVILKACAFDPDERYQSAEELLKALNRVIRGLQGVVEKKPAAHPQKKAQPKAEYATVAAEVFNTGTSTNDYKTMPANADGLRKKCSFSTEPAKRRTYATKPTEEYKPRYVTQASVHKNKNNTSKVWIRIALLGLCIAVFGAGFLLMNGSDKHHSDEKDIILQSESVPETITQSTTSPPETVLETTAYETTIMETAAVETETAEEGTYPSETQTEHVETRLVYLRTSNSNDNNDLVYEYNEDGTLHKFANRIRSGYTTNYYIYDDGTLVSQIGELQNKDSNQKERLALIDHINSLAGYPIEENIEYRILVLNGGFPTRLIFVDENLYISYDETYTYDSMGNRISTASYNYNKEIREPRRYLQYDLHGNLVCIESYVGDTFSKTMYSYSYNTQGRVIEETRVNEKQEKTVWKYSYNSQNQLIRKEEYDEWGTPTGTYYEYSYDDYGNAIQEKAKHLATFGAEVVSYMNYMELQVPEGQLDILQRIYDYSIGFLPLNITDQFESVE